MYGNGFRRQMCMILPWQIHSFYTRDFSRTIVLVVAHSYMDDFLNSMRGYYGQTQVFRPEPAIQELFMQYLFTGPFPDPYIIASVLLGLCHCFTVQCPILPCEDSRRAPALYDAFNYISAHYKEPLTLGSVAAELGYSYYYLSHIFKSYAGWDQSLLQHAAGWLRRSTAAQHRPFRYGHRLGKRVFQYTQLQPCLSGCDAYAAAALSGTVLFRRGRRTDFH